RYCDLESVVKRALEHLQSEIEERDADINVEKPLHPVLATNTVLDQVISNLIANAIKFVPEDRKPEVDIWTESTAEKVKLFILDNGIGIKESEKDNIFKMFNRLHGIEKYDGTGVGLAIVKKAMDKLEGEYGFDSNPGEGSTFWIELKEAKGM
ncbi:MAG: sensor histidine kinase, partial [Thermoplasmatota archaeon]